MRKTKGQQPPSMDLPEKAAWAENYKTLMASFFHIERAIKWHMRFVFERPLRECERFARRIVRALEAHDFESLGTEDVFQAHWAISSYCLKAEISDHAVRANVAAYGQVLHNVWSLRHVNKHFLTRGKASIKRSVYDELYSRASVF